MITLASGALVSPLRLLGRVNMLTSLFLISEINSLDVFIYRV